MQVNSRGILFKVLPPLRPRNRNDVFTLSQHPCQRKLRRLVLLLPRNFFHAAHQLEVLLEICALKPWRRPPVVLRREILEFPDLLRKEAAPQRAVRDEANPQLAARRQNFVFGVARPQRVFGLQRRNRMDLRRAPQRFRCRLRQSDEPHLSFLHQPGHRAHRLLDRRIGIDPVLVIQVNRLHAKPAQTGVAALAHIFRLATHAARVWIIRIPHDPEFRRQHNFFALPANRFPNQFLILERPVNVRRVEKIDSQLERPVNRRDRFLVVARAIKLRHPHTAEPNLRNREAASSPFARLHVLTSWCILLLRWTDSGSSYPATDAQSRPRKAPDSSYYVGVEIAWACTSANPLFLSFRFSSVVLCVFVVNFDFRVSNFELRPSLTTSDA